MTRPNESVQDVLESHGSGRVGSGGSQILTGRVGSSRVARFDPTREQPRKNRIQHNSVGGWGQAPARQLTISVRPATTTTPLLGSSWILSGFEEGLSKSMSCSLYTCHFFDGADKKRDKRERERRRQ